MEGKVLVAFATRYGATAEIAERICLVLQNSGLETDVLPADLVHDLSNYTAVVLGSAVYIGKWRKPAVKFIQTNEKLLANRPVWLFSSGPTGEGQPVDLLEGWRYPNLLQSSIDIIQPLDIAVFHGAVIPEKMNFIERWMIKNIKSPVGDFRDWEAITAWANSIAEKLQEDSLSSG